MHSIKSVALLLIALLATNPLAYCQLEEGSGQVEAVTGEAVKPSLTDDYVNCPPGMDPEKSMMGDVEESAAQDDYDDYYDDAFQVPKVSEEENYTVENVSAVLVGEESLTTLIDDEGVEDGPVMGAIESVVDDDEDDDEDLEESSEDNMVEQSDEDLLNDYPVKLIKSPKIYNVPDSQTAEAKFAAYKKEHSEEIELVSPGYPEPYPDIVDEGYQEFNVSEGIGVQVTIHELDLDPTSDFLHIRGGSANDTDEKGPIFTGKIDKPLRFLIAHTTTFSVRFLSQHEEGAEPHGHRGFRLTYAPFGTRTEPTTTTTTEPPVPQEEYQWIRKEIAVSKAMMQALDTWARVRAELANASNPFVEEHKLKYKPCKPEDIRIVAQKCPDTWPNYEECVTLRFAVPLRPEPVEEDQSPQGISGLFGKSYISVSTTEPPKQEYQLSEANLERMWNDYGAMALAQIGIEAYKMPENAQILLIWIAISLCILAAFIFVLYSIWKIDFFKDYRRISKMNREQPDDDRNELKKKEFDISMFPSPHQIVPSFFPTGDPYNERADEQYAYDNSTMNPFAEEAFEVRQSPKPRPKQQVFEPLSPTDYSPSIVDINEIPEPRSPRRSRNNPFLPTNGGGGGFNQAGSRP
uniref:CUB domain-containing protein n=1 Tax=Culex tarsalis TaxID=7177 RepID=A0A1Q3FMC6_CULTA